MKKIYRCPECNSTAVYQLVSIVAKQNLNGKEVIFDIDKTYVDNYFSEIGYCKKCGWEGSQDDLKEDKM